jgi:hypothetical protein
MSKRRRIRGIAKAERFPPDRYEEAAFEDADGAWRDAATKRARRRERMRRRRWKEGQRAF